MSSIHSDFDIELYDFQLQDGPCMQVGRRGVLLICIVCVLIMNDFAVRLLKERRMQQQSRLWRNTTATSVSMEVGN